MVISCHIPDPPFFGSFFQEGTQLISDNPSTSWSIFSSDKNLHFREASPQAFWEGSAGEGFRGWGLGAHQVRVGISGYATSLYIFGYLWIMDLGTDWIMCGSNIRSACVALLMLLRCWFGAATVPSASPKIRPSALKGRRTGGDGAIVGFRIQGALVSHRCLQVVNGVDAFQSWRRNKCCMFAVFWALELTCICDQQFCER